MSQGRIDKRVGPRENGLATRVVRFFEDNPDEELTYEDLCAKFDTKIRTAHLQIKRAQHEGRGIEVVTVIRLKRQA